MIGECDHVLVLKAEIGEVVWFSGKSRATHWEVTQNIGHSEENHQTIMLSNIPAIYILQHPTITGWLKLVNTIHW